MIATPQATKFGRLYAPDVRDAAYPLKASRIAAAVRVSRHWNVGPILDQGDKPQCVGYAWAQFLASAPIMTRHRVLPSYLDIYREAQRVDEWPGENYDGTSVRAGAKFLQKAGILLEYRWALDAGTLKDFLLTRGPVVVGTDWFSGMSTPRWIDNKKSSLNDAYLDPSGQYEGGHAYTLVGYSRVRSAYRMVNSWGIEWGEHGRAWIAEDVMDHIIFGLNGEAVSAVEKIV